MCKLLRLDLPLLRGGQSWPDRGVKTQVPAARFKQRAEIAQGQLAMTLSDFVKEG